MRSWGDLFVTGDPAVGDTPADTEEEQTGFFRRLLPSPLRRWMERTPFAQDVIVGHVQCVLQKP